MTSYVTRVLRGFFTSRWTAALFLSFLIGIQGIGIGRPPIEQFSEAVRLVIADLALIARVWDDAYKSDIALERAGFDYKALHINDETWKTFPVIRKLETAYLSALEVSPENAKKFLVEMRRLAGENYPILVSDGPENKSPITFRPIASTAWETRPSGSITPEAARALEKIAVLCDSGGGLYSCLTRGFGLQSKDAFEVMRRGGTIENSLALGYLRVPEGKRDAAMSSAVEMVSQHYPLAAREFAHFDKWRPSDDMPPSVFDRFHPRGTDPPGGISPTHPNDPKRPSEGGAGGIANVQVVKPHSVSPSSPTPAQTIRNYDRFLQRSYGGGKGGLGKVKFTPVVRFRGGFGGVVLGNDVTDETNLKLLKIQWLPSVDDKNVGRLECEFAGGMVDYIHNVRLEDAYAAHLIVFAGIGAKDDAGDARLAPVEDGEAIGLVGLENWIRHFEDGDNQIREGTRWNYVIHPAIANLTLGRAAVMCDVLPLQRAKSILVDQVLRASDRNTAMELASLLNKASSTYKFFDMPVTIKLTKERHLELVSEGINAKGAPPETRRTAFITFQAFAQGEKPVKGVPAQFYKIVPKIVSASPAYARLNDFARVLAVYRWARSRQAKSSPPPMPHEIAAAGSVITMKEGVFFAPPFDQLDAAAQLYRTHLSTTLAQVLKSSCVELQTFDKKFVELQDSLEKQGQPYWKVESQRRQIQELVHEAITKLTSTQKQEYEELSEIIFGRRDGETGNAEEAWKKQRSILAQAVPSLVPLQAEYDQLIKDLRAAASNSGDAYREIEAAGDEFVKMASASEPTERWRTLLTAQGKIDEALKGIEAARQETKTAITAMEAAQAELPDDFKKQLAELDGNIAKTRFDERVEALDARKKFVAENAPKLAAAKAVVDATRDAERDAAENFANARSDRDDVLYDVVPTFQYWMQLRRILMQLARPSGLAPSF